MAKKLTKTQVKKKYMSIVNATKRLLDDKLSQPKTSVTMSPKDLMMINEKFMRKAKQV
jgi:hypothetical protein|tara:strand:+ start:552 stop:725 length:174 start_codon:yes stop_codon:yes gene_type:complete